MAKTYVNISMDQDLDREVSEFFEAHKEAYSSKRALYHDLLRRGLLSLGEPTSPSSKGPTTESVEGPTTPRRRRVSDEVQPDPTEAATAPRLADGAGSVPRGRDQPAVVAATPIAAAHTEHQQPASSVGTAATSSEGIPPSRRSLRPEPKPVGGPTNEADAAPAGHPSPALIPSAPSSAGAAARDVLAIRTSHPVTNPEDRKIVREVAVEISTWTCPKCHVTIPLLERWSHTHIARGDRESGVARNTNPSRPQTAVSVRTADVQPATAQVAARPVRLDAVLDVVKMFLRGQNAREAKTADERRAFVVAAIAIAHHEQHVEISTAEASELVAGLATREPAIERYLEPPSSLSMPTPTDKGGSRGRK